MPRAWATRSTGGVAAKHAIVEDAVADGIEREGGRRGRTMAVRVRMVWSREKAEKYPGMKCFVAQDVHPIS